MAEEVERSAASVEEAIEAALAELGVTEQQVDVEIVQEPRGGFLGLGGQEARVRVRLKRAEEGPSRELLDEQAEMAAEFLDGLLQRMGLDADVEPAFVEETMYVDVWGAEDTEEEMGLLIGRQGQTLDALQEVVRAVVQRRSGERCRVLVDVEDYRKRRRSRLVSQARQVAQRVKRSGKRESLEPMNAFERKVVHDTVAGLGGLETVSEGEEPNRRVTIRPVG